MGFTLIELLVVIAIISLLVSILLPSLTKAKELARRAVCASNLHQMGVAIGMYQHDHDGELIAATNFYHIRRNYSDAPGLGGALYPNYISDGHLFYCPSLTQPGFTYNDASIDMSNRDDRVYDFEEMWNSEDALAAWDMRSGYCQMSRALWLFADSNNLMNELYTPDQSNIAIMTDNFRWTTDGRQTHEYDPVIGLNVLYSGGAVEWFQDTSGVMETSIPLMSGAAPWIEAGIWRYFQDN